MSKLKLEDLTGVGPKLAEKIREYLQQNNLPEILDAEYIKKMLPESAIMHLKYKPEKAVQRKKLQKVVQHIEKANGVVAGSWRRGSDRCNDLDILLSVGTVIPDFIKKTKLVFTVPFVDGEFNIRMFLKFAPSCYIQADIFLYENFAAHLLHSTGSVYFNIRMRGIAVKQGYKLNQKGLFKNKQEIPIKTEKDVFDILGMKYLEPHERSH